MANWVTETTTSSFDQSAAINTAMTNRQSVRETGAGNEGNNGAASGFLGIGGSKGLSLVGLSAARIEIVKSTIRDQVSQIEATLNNMDAEAATNAAFKSHNGHVEDAVRQAVDNVKQYVINLTSGLLAFNTKLNDVIKAWETQSETMATNINSATGASDVGSKYSEDQ